MQHLEIEVVPGNKGPSYPQQTVGLNIVKAVVTEQGTENGLPIVDLILEDVAGNRYMAMTTGRLINSLSAVIKGTNKRIHGIEEP